MGLSVKKRRLTAVCAVLLAAGMTVSLSACGDDLSAGVAALTFEDVAQPIGTNQSTDENSGEAGSKDGSGGAASGKQSEEQPAGQASQDGGTVQENLDASQEPVTITISAAGDASLGNHQEQEYYYSFRQAYDEAENPGYFMENVYDIFSADDMTVINFEGVLTFSNDMRPGQTYSIKGDPEYAQILTYGSVEAAAMGNNHRLDYKEQGSADTVKALEAEGIVWAFEENVGIYETKGVRIGFVSVNEVSQGAAVEKTIQEGIARLQEEGADIILACCHWGIERENYPEDYQKVLGRKCIDWGADLVIGHHPHVLQGIEEYKGKYIVYSLGNFCFGANRNPDDKDCMIFQQTFTFVNGEKQEDAPVKVIPCSVSSVSSRNDFKPTPAAGDEAKRIINRINEYSSAFGVQFDEEGQRVETIVAEGQG